MSSSSRFRDDLRSSALGTSNRPRLCSRNTCREDAVSSMSYDYSTSTVIIDSLQTRHPTRYDLCVQHTQALTVPRGWTILAAADAFIVPRVAERLGAMTLFAVESAAG